MALLLNPLPQCIALDVEKPTTSLNKNEGVLMSEDYGYGDCRDSCIQYAIEGEYACDQCFEDAEQAMRDEEKEFDMHAYDQG